MSGIQFLRLVEAGSSALVPDFRRRARTALRNLGVRRETRREISAGARAGRRPARRPADPGKRVGERIDDLGPGARLALDEQHPRRDRDREPVDRPPGVERIARSCRAAGRAASAIRPRRSATADGRSPDCGSARRSRRHRHRGRAGRAGGVGMMSSRISRSTKPASAGSAIASGDRLVAEQQADIGERSNGRR